MLNKTALLILIALTVVAAAASVTLYDRLPEQMVTHWNAAGVPDGYSGRFFGAFLIPLLMVGLALLAAFIPFFDPLKKNLARFAREYGWFWAALFGFLLYIHFLQLYWNAGGHFTFQVAMLPAMAALFWVIGVVLGRAKRNWFMGIRTPWTLSSDKVWDLTHALGARLFKLAALLTLFGLLLPAEAAFWLVVAPALAGALITTVYSFVLYRRLES